ncbi:MAG: nucleotide sugar dehydrogenase [Dysgonamonadaceae bacterium]|jgi:UDP-N-acetyl-D-galactosamine dehydrogenase|nr:nucleotide sugar dehydrogenase [Dysgonamonadaceae bacterium]
MLPKVNNNTPDDTPSIAVIGLGYVGLPLAVAFAKKYPVVGFDTNVDRIKELKSCRDHTREVAEADLKAVIRPGYQSCGLFPTNDASLLRLSTIFIVTVPTPITKSKSPDLSCLIDASKTVGAYLKRGDTVIYESTVYPGCTEEDCVPVLEQASGMRLNKDFFCGYSPERINPGDKIHTLTTIRKVTSGSTPEAAARINRLYASIIDAGTYSAPSIKVAEAAKAIENAQRDLNISFVNELALIFERMHIDTSDVLDAAATKWNFLKFKPGLVGGHCIGVDPYYLMYKAQILGYHPQVILSGRNVNDSMGVFIANKIIKLMVAKDLKIKSARVLILGFTFKDNCPDIRNTRIIDIYNELCSFGIAPDVFDPLANPEEVMKDYGIRLMAEIPDDCRYDAMVIAVAHSHFLSIDFEKYKLAGTIIFDTKSFIDRKFTDARL